VDLWFTTRRFSSPMMGQPLPCPGSPAEQPAALLDAFLVLERLEKSDG
jgi:hypothetical protein